LKQQIERIAATVERGEPVDKVTVREFLGWFDAQRRGQKIVAAIRDELEEANLESVPDFESVWIDGPISFQRKTAARQSEVQHGQLNGQEEVTDQGTPRPHETEAPRSWVSRDPAYHISKLASANKGVLWVNPDAPLAHAVTEMIARDFSQLAVATSERNIKGAISWKSIGCRLALNQNGEFVRDYLERPQEVRPDTSILEVIGLVVRYDYVIVSGDDRRMAGIVTASDLSEQFHALTEPFLLLGEIENLLRNLIGKGFSVQELQAAKDPNDLDREVNGVSDLTFGEYIRLLENPDRWVKLQLAVDRRAFCTKLQGIREIRNGVMHFDPDGIEPKDLTELQNLARLLKRLDGIGVI
jgi:CBS domain-containing protein